MSSTELAAKFERCVQLWRMASDREIQNGTFKFKLPIDQINEFGDPISAETDGWYTLRPPLASMRFVFAKNIEALIANPHCRTTQPDKFYLAETDTLVEEGQADHPEHQHLIASYLIATEIIQLLQSVADHEYRDANQTLQLVFLYEEKLLMPVVYEANDLDGLTNHQEILAQWRDHLQEKGHLVQKKAIFKKLLIEESASIPQSQRLACFFQRFRDFYQRYISRYETYAAEVSAEAVLDELEQAKMEWVAKIHKTVTDLNTQILIAPLALLLGVSRLASKPQEIAANAVVTLSILLFAWLLHLSISLQQDQIAVIEETLKTEQKNLKDRHEAYRESIGKIYDALNDQLNSAKKRLRGYRSIGWLLIGLSLGLFALSLICLKA